MSVLSLDLSHNDFERLLAEFLEPLAKFFPGKKDEEETTVKVDVEDRRHHTSESVVVRIAPYFLQVDESPYVAQWEFFEDGTVLKGIHRDDGESDWSTVALEIVRLIREQMCKEIKRVDERVKPALAKFDEAIPSLCEVLEI